MQPGERRFCLSLDVETAASARTAVRDLAPRVGLVELRLDRLDPRDVQGGEWRTLPGEGTRAWIATWRSPAEGGARPRPPGILKEALESGFSWIDVEARALDAGGAEVHAVPPERRWVSRHLPVPPTDREEIRAAWRSLAAAEGAMRKLVVAVERFPVNDWILEVQAEAVREGAATVFGLGDTGHVSRLLGALRGNAVTFLAAGRGRETAPGQPDVDTALGLYRLDRVSTGTSLYGVLGHPVRASRSPHLHNRVFEARGWDSLYVLLDAPEPEGVLNWLRRGTLRGVSVTAPHKETVVPHLDRLEDAAREIGAVNTIWREGDSLVGANTDAEATGEILDPLPPGGVAILGAGGAARAVAHAARRAGREATLFHRDPVRGQERAKVLGTAWGGSWDALRTERFAAVCNATPVGSAGEIPAGVLSRPWGGGAFIDLAYGAESSGWEGWVAAGGGTYIGGLDFLARQARGQLRRWTGEDVSLSELREEAA